MLFLLLMFISGEVIYSQDDHHRTTEEMIEYCDENPWDAECQDFVIPKTEKPSRPVTNDTSIQVEDEHNQLHWMAIINFGLILIGLALIFRKKIKERCGPTAEKVKARLNEEKSKLLGESKVDLDVSGGSTTIFHTPNGTMINKSYPPRPQAYQNVPPAQTDDQIYAEVYQPPSTTRPSTPQPSTPRPNTSTPAKPPVPPPAVPPPRRRSTSLPRPLTPRSPAAPRPDYDETPVFYTPRENQTIRSHSHSGHYPMVKTMKEQVRDELADPMSILNQELRYNGYVRYNAPPLHLGGELFNAPQGSRRYRTYDYQTQMSEDETLTNRDEPRRQNIPTTQPSFKPENPSGCAGCSGGCTKRRESPIKTEYVDKRRSNGHCPADKSTVNTSGDDKSTVNTSGDDKSAVSAKPVNSSPKPAADTAKPAADTAKPAADTAKPVADTAKPAAATAKPAAATSKPAAATATGAEDELGDSEIAELLEIADEFIEQSAEKSAATDSSDESPLYDEKSDSEESDFDKTVKSNKSALVKSEAKTLKSETKIIKSEPTAAEDNSGGKSGKKGTRDSDSKQGQKKKPFKP